MKKGMNRLFFPIALAVCPFLWGCDEEKDAKDGSSAAETNAKALPEEAEYIGAPTWPSRVPEGRIDFEKHVRPLLIINCMECHNVKDAPQNGNFILETRKLAMSTGTKPPALVPGKPDESHFIRVLTLEPMHRQAMPPTPDKIWGVRMEILKRWIADGAEWPEEIRLVHPREIKEW
jgi:hypothetical protein